MDLTLVVGIVAALLGSGGLAALHRSKSQTKTDLYDQVNKSQAQINEDERQIRAFIQQELIRREESYQKALDAAEKRVEKLNAGYDDLVMKYRDIRADYTMLRDRYTSQAYHIQNITAITLDRDYWKRQAEQSQLQLRAMEARISCMEGEINELRSKVLANG